MEKRGEILNQFAIISDLLENVNLDVKSTTINIDLDNENFDKTFNLVQKKYGKKINEVNNTFTITIGIVDIIFSTNNV